MLKHSKKVLIVDDSLHNVTIISDILQKEGMEVVATNRSTHALSLAEEALPDLILLDIRMPEIDGFTVCQTLKQNEKTSDIPVIFLTANNENQAIVKGFEIGAIDYIIKPFNRQELLARINTHLELAEKKEKLENYIKIVDKYVLTSITDAKGTILYVSEAFCKMSGYSKSEFLGKTHNLIRHPEMHPEVYKDLWNTIQNGKPWKGEIKNRCKNGGYYWVEVYIEPLFSRSGNIIGYQAIRMDITDKKRIEELSITDRLTNLYNRLKLDEIFEYELARSQRYGNPFSIILTDLDNFKVVNDTYGHQAGDNVLREFSKLLKETVRKTDSVGRWGGEEFVIVLPQTGLKEAEEVAERICVKIAEHEFVPVGHKTASFGVAAYQSGDTVDTLIKRADDALYLAKSQGRNRVMVSK